MTSLSRRSFLLGTSAIVASAVLPGPIVALSPNPLTSAEFTERILGPMMEEWQKVYLDMVLYGQGRWIETKTSPFIRYIPWEEYFPQCHTVNADFGPGLISPLGATQTCLSAVTIEWPTALAEPLSIQTMNRAMRSTSLTPPTTQTIAATPPTT